MDSHISADTPSDTNKETVTASPDKVDYNGTVTLTATYSDDAREDLPCRWYKVGADGSAALIEGANDWTYTTPALTADTTYRAEVVSHSADKPKPSAVRTMCCRRFLGGYTFS